jgi:aspartokinase
MAISGPAIVQKYGGSFVAASEIEAWPGAWRSTRLRHRVVVVVSAMGKTTDGLSLASRSPAPDPREMV